ncbi:hypothetical protein [Cyanothece sp. BG0011]|uniref:hypothetical protein n=1 Tax=Cyanothece sp. BG0011 TaxID=2082950 RepID=UPI000D1DAC72|nr:hypothetical protein [Cyanothece sp. BG0011]
MKLIPLPAPDFWDFAANTCKTCLLTDDGSATTTQVAQCLINQGWQVGVLSFPDFLIPSRPSLPSTVQRFTLTHLSEEHLQEQLSNVVETYGLIGNFIHLHPLHDVLPHQGHTRVNPNKAIVKQVFLLAKHLKSSLHQAASQGRACFLTLAHLDGEFGLSGNQEFSPISGGLFGLTKTLNLEWQSVFCRSLDISPDLDEGTTAQIILAELHDPNTLIQEVGYTPKGRVTLDCELAPLTI